MCKLAIKPQGRYPGEFITSRKRQIVKIKIKNWFYSKNKARANRNKYFFKV